MVAGQGETQTRQAPDEMPAELCMVQATSKKNRGKVKSVGNSKCTDNNDCEESKEPRFSEY